MATAKTTATETKTADVPPVDGSKAGADLFASLKAKAETVKAVRIFTDKKALVGIPFVITSWAIVPSESAGLTRRSVKYAEVNYVTETGKTGTFRDSSTKGVREQLVSTLTEEPKEGVFYDTPILAPAGIEVRTFLTESADGKEVEGTVYALTGSAE